MVSKKKKKRSSPKLEVIFRPGSLGLGWWGDASLTGAELFEIETDFLAKIVTFRLVGGMGGMHPFTAVEGLAAWPNG